MVAEATASRVPPDIVPEWDALMAVVATHRLRQAPLTPQRRAS